MDIVFVDTETTGLIPGQICELTAIVESNNNIVDVKNYFFKVDHVDERASSVNGLTAESLERLSNGKVFSDYSNEIYELLKGKCIVAHNIAFDEKFISAEMWRCGISFMPDGRLDTMEYFRDIIKLPARYRKNGMYKNPKLSEVVQFLKIDEDKVAGYCSKLFNINDSEYHDSRFDATIMYVAVNVYREVLNGGSYWRTTFCK